MAPHIAELVAWIGTQPGLRLSGVIVQRGMVPPTFLEGPGWKFVTALERRRLRGRRLAPITPVTPVAPDFTPCEGTRRIVRPTRSGVPGTWVLGDEDIAGLKAARFDLLIQCGTGTWSGDALGCARLGMILFNDVANESDRGGPPGFWEVYRRTAKTEFVIRHVARDAGAPSVLRRGYVPTRTYALLNADGLSKQASSHLRQLLVVVSETGALPLPLPVPVREAAIECTGARDRSPNMAESIAYLCKLSARAAAFRFREAVGLRERWGVAYAVSNWRDAKLSEGLKIGNPRGRYFADPFLLTVGNETFCFVEDFVEAKGRAVISVLQLGPNGYSVLGKALEEDFHLSFPYLFEYDGGLYMCPESQEAREIRGLQVHPLPARVEAAVGLHERRVGGRHDDLRVRGSVVDVDQHRRSFGGARLFGAAPVLGARPLERSVGAPPVQPHRCRPGVRAKCRSDPRGRRDVPCFSGARLRGLWLLRQLLGDHDDRPASLRRKTDPDHPSDA